MGYTYYRDQQSSRFYCSKKQSGGYNCKAKVKLDSNGAIDSGDFTHNHRPPHYVKTSTGKYVKISE